MSRYGDTCDLSGPLAALSTALEQANALGLYNNPLVISAQSTYDTYSTMSLDCDGIAAATPTVNGMTVGVQALVAKSTPAGGFTVGPDATQGLSTAGVVGLGLVGVWVAWWVVTK